MNYFITKNNISQLRYKEIIWEYEQYVHPSMSSMNVDINKFIEKSYKFADILTIYESDNENLLGIAVYYNNDMENHVSYLTFLCINPFAQNYGFGGILLKKWEKDALNKSMKTLKLEVYKKNKKAVAFYTLKGFNIIWSTNDSYYMIKNI